MLLEVRGQDGFNDKEAKALELHMLQVDQEVELWPGQIEVPGGRGVVVLQHRPVIVEHGLHSRVERRGGRSVRVGSLGIQLHDFL